MSSAGGSLMWPDRAKGKTSHTQWTMEVIIHGTGRWSRQGIPQVLVERRNLETDVQRKDDVRTHGEENHLQPSREASKETALLTPRFLYFQPPELWEINVYCSLASQPLVFFSPSGWSRLREVSSTSSHLCFFFRLRPLCCPHTLPWKLWDEIGPQCEQAALFGRI